MSKLLKFEWRKLWQQKSFYIIFSLGLISIILFLILGKVMLNISQIKLDPTESMMVVIPNSGFVSLLAIYLALFVCTDYSQHTIKNIYARGYSRSSVYFSKYLISLFVTFAVAILYIVFAFVLTLMLGGHIENVSPSLWINLALQFWVLIGLHGLYFGISMIFANKTGVCIALNLIGISLLFGFISLFLQISRIDFDLSAYELEHILSSLVGDQPLMRMDIIRILVTSVSYGVIFITAGWLVNRRRDV